MTRNFKTSKRQPAEFVQLDESNHGMRWYAELILLRNGTAKIKGIVSNVPEDLVFRFPYENVAEWSGLSSVWNRVWFKDLFPASRNSNFLVHAMTKIAYESFFGDFDPRDGGIDRAQTTLDLDHWLSNIRIKDRDYADGVVTIKAQTWRDPIELFSNELVSYELFHQTTISENIEAKELLQITFKAPTSFNDASLHIEQFVLFCAVF